ncbi:MAG: hypothetical protein WC996_02770 [Peptostreptococcales bacterium]
MFDGFDKDNIYATAARRMRNLNVPDNTNKDPENSDKHDHEPPKDIKCDEKHRPTNVNHIFAAAERMRNLEPSPIPAIDFKKILKRFKK